VSELHRRFDGKPTGTTHIFGQSRSLTILVVCGSLPLQLVAACNVPVNAGELSRADNLRALQDRDLRAGDCLRLVAEPVLMTAGAGSAWISKAACARSHCPLWH
jgi:hypothetical protein